RLRVEGVDRVLHRFDPSLDGAISISLDEVGRRLVEGFTQAHEGLELRQRFAALPVPDRHAASQSQSLGQLRLADADCPARFVNAAAEGAPQFNYRSPFHDPILGDAAQKCNPRARSECVTVSLAR